MAEAVGTPLRCPLIPHLPAGLLPEDPLGHAGGERQAGLASELGKKGLASQERVMATWVAGRCWARCEEDGSAPPGSPLLALPIPTPMPVALVAQAVLSLGWGSQRSPDNLLGPCLPLKAGVWIPTR